MDRLLIPALCLILLHAPDGSKLAIQSRHIAVVRPASEVHKQNFAKGTKTVIYTEHGDFGVSETPDFIVKLLEKCHDPAHPRNL